MKTAVLLMAFGGPESVEQVGPFMAKLMGRAPAPTVVERVIERYRRIGGGSPLPATVRAKAEALETVLRSDFPGIVVRAAFQYAHPTIDSVVRQLASEGYRRVVGISDSPHYSRVTTGAYREQLHDAATSNGMLAVDGAPYFEHPHFLDGIASTAIEARSALPKPDEAFLLFTAHSLPVDHVANGDPYVEELGATIAGVLDRLPRHDWQLAYQSKGMGKGDWLEPLAESSLERLAERGHPSVLLVPVGFTSEHVETLYDIDILIAGKARELALTFHRARALNDHPKLIAALAASVSTLL